MTTLRAEITPALLDELANKTKRLELTSKRLKVLRRKAGDSKLTAEDKPHVSNARHAKLLGEIEIAEAEERRLLNRIKKIEDIHDIAKKRRRRKPEVSLSPDLFEQPKPKRTDKFIFLLLMLIIMFNWSSFGEQRRRAQKLEQEKRDRQPRHVAILPVPGGGKSRYQTV